MQMLRQILRILKGFAVRDLNAEASSSPVMTANAAGHPSARRTEEKIQAISLLPVLSEKVYGAASTLQNSVLKVSENFSELAKTSRQAVESAQGGLNRYGNSEMVLDEIASGLDQIDEMAEVAHVVSINAQIESTRPVPSREAFMALATETSRLSEQCKTASRRIGEVLQKVRTLQQAMIRSIADSGSVSQDLERQIAQAVIGMQFQDPLTQQLNSIAIAVDAIREEMNPLLSSAGTGQDSELPSQWKYWFESLPAVTSGHPMSDGATVYNCGSVELF